MPGIYTKLITVDKVDLLLGPYATNFVAPAMPTIMQHNKMTISLTAIGINRHFNYDKYFSMVPVGPDGVNAFSKGFFELAAAAKAEAANGRDPGGRRRVRPAAADGAREELKKHGFKIVYDQSYPPATTDFTPMVRAVQAANPDIVYVAAYPPDNVGIIRAANEIDLNAEDVRRRHDRHADHADPRAARADRQRAGHRRDASCRRRSCSSPASTT